MSSTRDAAEVLALAHQVHGPPAPRRGRSPSAPPAARAPSAVPPSAPARPAPAERARPGLTEEGRPLWMERMGIPLTGLSNLTLARIEELERLAGPGKYSGWGREPDYGPFFVDVGADRFRGPSLHHALSAALAAARYSP